MDPAVEEALRLRRDQVIGNWFRRVSKRPAARHLSLDLIMNNIPGLVDAILDGLAKAAASSTPPPIPKDLSRKHGESRLDLGYGLQELGEEYNSLRDAFLEALDEAGIHLNNTTASVLHGAVDQVHRTGVECFIELREERIRKRQSDFLARLVHDFRSPLSIILTSIGLVRKQGSTGEGVPKNLDRMERATRRLLFLIEGQLATEGALSGKFQIREMDVRVAEVAQDVAELLHPRAEEQGVDLRVEVPSGLELKTDRLLLGQVLQNLVDNALKYTDSGQVVLRASEEEGGVRILVKDTGRGIPPEFLSVIFDMYKRTEHTSSGRGVGLAVVKAVVTALGGEVKADSKQGQGSRFEVWLPRRLLVRERAEPQMALGSHEPVPPMI
jgi:signal transduction histidine kinase